jgi:hypothetical protein
MGRHDTPDQRRSGYGRQFGLVVALIGLLLSVAGLLLLGNAGLLEAIAIAALAYGIGLLVSGVFLSAGWRPGERTAEVILAELGPDMSRFPTHRHAASRAAVCPGHDESAGKRRSGKTRKGDSWLRTALIEAAQSAAGRTSDTYLHSQYLRVERRRGHRKAIVAVAHSILVAAYYILSEEKPTRTSEATTSSAARTPNESAQRLVRQLERLGQSVTLEPALEAR